MACVADSRMWSIFECSCREETEQCDQFPDTNDCPFRKLVLLFDQEHCGNFCQVGQTGLLTAK